MIHVKNPKSKKKEGEFVDLFLFPEKSVCPVTSLISLNSYRNCNDVNSLARNSLLRPHGVYNLVKDRMMRDR